MTNTAPLLAPNDLPSIIYNDRPGKHGFPCGETKLPQVSQPQEKIKIMGDRSPKANQKKSSQKQAKVNSADEKKKHAIAAKQAAGKK